MPPNPKRHFIFYVERMKDNFVFRSLEGADRFVRSKYTPGSDDNDNLMPITGTIHPVKEENDIYIAEPPKEVSSQMRECKCGCVEDARESLLSDFFPRLFHTYSLGVHAFWCQRSVW